MNTNIYKIKPNELNDFIVYNNTTKLIVFYKQDCVFCKSQINDLKSIAIKYIDNINCAICDVSNKTKFCINNDIVGLPTIHIYKNSKLVYKHSSSIEISELEKIINNINKGECMQDKIELQDEQLSIVSGGNTLTLIDVQTTIINIIKDRTSPNFKLDSSFSLIDDLGADSLDVVDIVQVIEDEFEISLQDQVIPNNLTIAGISQIVFNRINPNKA